MTTLQTVVWAGGLGVIVLCIVLSLVAARRPSRVLGLAGLIPLTVVGLAVAFDVRVAAPSPAWAVGMALAVCTLGVLGGGPATTAVLDLATHRDAQPGRHGGILILDGSDGSDRGDGAARPAVGSRHEVLRGGAAIGYLERFAVVSAITVGHLEIVAAVIAVKGLGRFSELDSAQARERFIIGTLASMAWAGAAAGLVVLLR